MPRFAACGYACVDERCGERRPQVWFRSRPRLGQGCGSAPAVHRDLSADPGVCRTVPQPSQAFLRLARDRGRCMGSQVHQSFTHPLLKVAGYAVNGAPWSTSICGDRLTRGFASVEVLSSALS